MLGDDEWYNAVSCFRRSAGSGCCDQTSKATRLYWEVAERHLSRSHVDQTQGRCVHDDRAGCFSRRQAAEIISLLYESTQRPPKSNKDPSHPGGGGVFLAHGDARTGDYGMLKGTLDEEAEGESMVPGRITLTINSTDPRSTSLLNVGPLTSPMYGGTNVNPTLNNMPGQTSGNVLDDPQASGMLEQFAMANGLLQGIPGGMFDWGV